MRTIIAYLLLLAPIFTLAQFPTAIGTKWEFFQFYEDNQQASHVMDCFQDEVVGDTLAGGNIYQIVRRTGRMYHGNGFGPSVSYYDTVDGTWYYRVQGTQVLALDSVVSGTPYESLLYEFGLALGDTLAGFTKNLMEMTFATNPPPSGCCTAYYSQDSMCSDFMVPLFCTDPWVMDTEAAVLPAVPAAKVWEPVSNIRFLAGIGTVYSFPFQSVLGIYGQHYYLKRLTSQDQVLFVNPLIATAINQDPMVNFATIYPNPSEGHVQISSNLAVESIQVMDMMGKVVYELRPSRFDTKMELDLGQLPAGMYQVRLEAEGQAMSRNLILR